MKKSNTEKLETQLGNDFINAARLECSMRTIRFKVLKIHGGPYQVIGISDYIGSFKGMFLALEFKINDEPTPVQRDFLQDIAETSGMALCVNFINGPIVNNLTPFEIIDSCYETKNLQKVIYRNYAY